MQDKDKDKLLIVVKKLKKKEVSFKMDKLPTKTPMAAASKLRQTLFSALDTSINDAP